MIISFWVDAETRKPGTIFPVSSGFSMDGHNHGDDRRLGEYLLAIAQFPPSERTSLEAVTNNRSFLEILQADRLDTFLPHAGGSGSCGRSRLRVYFLIEGTLANW